MMFALTQRPKYLGIDLLTLNINKRRETKYDITWINCKWIKTIQSKLNFQDAIWTERQNEAGK